MASDRNLIDLTGLGIGGGAAFSGPLRIIDSVGVADITHPHFVQAITSEQAVLIGKRAVDFFS